MKRKTCVWTAVALTITAVIVIIAITLGIVLSQKNKKPPSPPSLDDTISNDATFPNGSTIIPVQSLKDGPAAMAPEFVTIQMLNQLGIRVDNSSLVAETGRLSYLYIRLPSTSASRTNVRVKRQIQNDADNITEYVGVRFGDADTINVVPLSLASVPASGLQIVGQLQDKSTMYSLQVRMPDSMCNGESEGTCTDVYWTAYSITSNLDVGSVGNFSTEMYVSCGSQCNAAPTSPCATSTCQNCDGVQVAGADTPVTRRYNMGTTSATLTLKYNTYTIKDVVRVSYEDQAVFDSGCVGTEVTVAQGIFYSGTSQELRVDVEPNCEGTTGTQWNFQLSCPSVCDINNSDQKPLLLNGNNVVNANDVTYITAEAQMPALVAYACNSVATFQWTLLISPTSGKDGPICIQKTYKGTGSQWDIRQAMGNDVQGGDATLSWSSDQPSSGSLKFKILGQNSATVPDIKAKIAELTSLWYAPAIPGAESAYKQFGKDGYPTRSYDNGYGLFQLTNTPTPNCLQIWSWIENTKGAVDKLNKQRYTNVDSAQNWMNGTYIGRHGKKPGQRQQAMTDEGHAVPVPTQNVDSGKCIFEDGTSRVIEDAVAIKMYNGASKMYCSWNNKVGTTDGYWVFSRVNANGKDYVADVCQFM